MNENLLIIKWLIIDIELYNVVKTIINYPFGNGFYNLFIVIWGMVYYCFNHIIWYIIIIVKPLDIWSPKYDVDHSTHMFVPTKMKLRFLRVPCITVKRILFVWLPYIPFTSPSSSSFLADILRGIFNFIQGSHSGHPSL